MTKHLLLSGAAALLAASLLAVPVMAQKPATAPTAQTAAPAMTDAAERMYQDHGAAVYQVQVIDRASGKKAAIGSGFQIDDQGLMATNYHVVSDMINRPANNRLEYLHEDGRRGVLTLVGVDVVNDLALLRMDKPGADHVALGTSNLRKGTRVFALGNPHDIGFTIVEGIHNGMAADTFHDKIHFSGAINQGMSGGPALSTDGRVVGINVMTGGNQIGFLVPVEALAALVQKYRSGNQGENFLDRAHADIEAQLDASQSTIIKTIVDPKHTWDRMTFGPLSLPGRLHPALKCWGAPAHEDKDPYTHFWSTCYNEDSLFLSDTFETGVYFYRYDLVTPSPEMWTARFYSFYEGLYSTSIESSNAGEGDVSNFSCKDGFVDQAGHRFKTSYCVRQYTKYPSLFDAHLYMAMVDAPRTGVVITANALGVTRDNAQAFMTRFVSEIAPASDAAPDVMDVVAPATGDVKDSDAKAGEVSP